MSYTDDMLRGRPATRKAPLFGERLSALRKQKGFTQSQFAKKVSLSIEMINYYERRCPNPSASFIEKAAKVLGVSADELIGTKPMRAQPGPKSKIEQRIETIKQLPRNKQKLVLDLLDTVVQSEAGAH
ncbi:helix-turn-helix domain-containing protein [Verrucomicrobiota bacterium]